MIATVGLLGGAGVPLPEYSVCVALDVIACLGLLKAVFTPSGVEEALFNPDEMAIKLLGGDQARAGAGKGVKDQVARIGTGQDDLGQQLLWLLSRVSSIFRH